MTEFNKDQALVRHISLSDQREAEVKDLLASGHHSRVETPLNIAIGELDAEARRYGYVFRCWQSSSRSGFIHTIQKVDNPIEWEHLRSYASDLDMEVTDQADTFSLMGHGKAATFLYTNDGRKQALAWLGKLDEEEYE